MGISIKRAPSGDLHSSSASHGGLANNYTAAGLSRVCRNEEENPSFSADLANTTGKWPDLVVLHHGMTLSEHLCGQRSDAMWLSLVLTRTSALINQYPLPAGIPYLLTPSHNPRYAPPP